MFQKLQNRKSKGFIWTMEILVSIAVFLIVSAIALWNGPKLVDFAKRGMTNMEAAKLAEACQMYEAEHISGKPPANLGALTQGLTKDQAYDGVARDPYVKVKGWTTDPTTIKDYWGIKYEYTASGTNRNITSTGNGVEPIVKYF